MRAPPSSSSFVPELIIKLRFKLVHQTFLTHQPHSLTFLPPQALPRDAFVVQTKVGRTLVPDRRARNGNAVGWLGGLHNGVVYDYSAAGFAQQHHDSLQRMGLGWIDALVVHDLEPTVHIVAGRTDGVREARAHLAVLRSSGFAELRRMRDERGQIAAFGAGMNSNEAGEDERKKRAWNKEYMQALVEMGRENTKGGSDETATAGGGGLDFMLLANMWSLLNFEALEDGILDQCMRAGISVVVGGPFSSGILATGADPANGSIPYYNYDPAGDEVRSRCRKIEAACARHGVPLIAAALQFPLRHPAVVSVIPGGKNVHEVESNVRNMNHPIPGQLWEDLRSEVLVPRGYDGASATPGTGTAGEPGT